MATPGFAGKILLSQPDHQTDQLDWIQPNMKLMAAATEQRTALFWDLCVAPGQTGICRMHSIRETL